jgi:1-acyl-sn-glycerol-3-phosphate acyltransferase
MYDYLYTLYAWTVGVVLTAFFGTIAIVLSIFDSSGNVVHICGRMWGRAILSAIGIKVYIQGKEHLPRKGNNIFISNHQGILDILVYEGYLHYQFRWIARQKLFDIPILGWSMKRAGYIPINREGRKQTLRSILFAAEQVKQGTTLLIFPEGTRSPDGKLQEFKKGALLIILKSLAPVTPLYIDGSYELLPKGTLIIKPGKIRITVFPAHYPEQLDDEKRNRLLQSIYEQFIEIQQHEQQRSDLPQG